MTVTRIVSSSRPSAASFSVHFKVDDFQGLLLLPPVPYDAKSLEVLDHDQDQITTHAQLKIIPFRYRL